MRILIMAAILLASTLASAETIYFIKGKKVSKGEALITSLQDPKVQVLKVQVNWVQANHQKATLRKVSDATIDSIPR